MVLFVGGLINNSTAVTNTTEMYDPVTKTLSFRAPMIVARRAHSCLLLRDGSLLVLGGVGDSSSLDAVERYDPSTNTWTLLAPMPLRSFGMGLTQLDDGRILLAGGSSTNWACFLFDPSSNTWTSTGSLNVGRFRLHLIKLPDNRVLAVGGGATSSGRRALEVYTPATGIWSLLAPMINSSGELAVILLPDGRVFVGNTDDGTETTRAEVYDVSQNTWTVLPPARGWHVGPARVGLVDGQPVAAGGRPWYAGATLIERFDFAQQRWTTLGQLGVFREEFTLDVLTDGSLLMVGGVDWGTRQNYAAMELLTSDTAPLAYSAANTDNAQKNTTNRTFTLNAGDTLQVGTCNVTGSSASGDTYLRLFGGGAQVAYNDDNCGSLASFIQYTAPTAGTYELRGWLLLG